jgi:hypothetical protein
MPLQCLIWQPAPQQVLVVHSQPLPLWPSQSAVPGVQPVTWQLPLTQDCPPPQTVEQLPQCCGSLWVLISQPLLLAFASQFAKPALQAMAQLPALHEGVPLLALQAAPQALQCGTLVLRLTSQPLPVVPSQLPNPTLQETIWHDPVVQEELAFGSAQATPHAPQSVAVLVGVSQPLLGLPSQLAQPAAQLGAHAPAVQAVPPWALLQATPQAPQFAVVVVAISQPSLTSPLQFAKPELQVMLHAPLEHDAEPPVLLHAVPQALQLSGSVLRFFSQPLE